VKFRELHGKFRLPRKHLAITTPIRLGCPVHFSLSRSQLSRTPGRRDGINASCALIIRNARQGRMQFGVLSRLRSEASVRYGDLTSKWLLLAWSAA